MIIKKNVLFVSKNNELIDFVKDVMSNNFNVVTAYSDNQCKTVPKINIDVILADCTEGLELLRNVSRRYMNGDVNSYVQIVCILKEHNNEEAAKAIEFGAWDFVWLPLDEEILMHRVNNAANANSVLYMQRLKMFSEFDSVTGIYNKQKFFEQARLTIDDYPNDKFALLRMDINRFSLINSFYGSEMGDTVLRRIANGLRAFAKQCSGPFVYGRIDADIFCICMRFKDKSDIENGIKNDCHTTLVDGDFSVIIAIGIYIIDDREIPVSTMYDRATLASKQIKGNYINTFAYYNDDMRLAIEADQQIINEMKGALESGEFVPYFQPKYDLATNKPAGAEALARWIHKEKGIISPAQFIPVFERNGFISKLDFYIWEEVCKYLAKWKKMGLPMLPVSVNVSRVNLYNPNLVNVITSLTDKYGIEPKYLNLELTESLYTEMNTLIDKTTGELQEKGYIIMMDDFGSGYSSLNVLKDVPVDVLKMDMRFMSKSKKAGRAENILASVVRMAKWLNMPVVAEGVDSQEQVDFLRGVGCEYIQGYYFAKPMPAEEYEKLIAKQEKFVEKSTSSRNLNMWSAANAISGIESALLPTGVFEYTNGNAEVISVNKAFYEEFGYEGMAVHSGNVAELIVPKDRDKLIKAAEESIRTGDICNCICRRLTPNGGRRWIKINLKYYGETDVSKIIIASFYDVTDERSTSVQLSFFNRGLNREKNRRKNILAVGAEDFDKEELERIFKDECNVVNAADCESGFLELQRKQIDLILLCQKNAVQESSDFVKNIRANEGGDHISIIAVLDDASAENQQAVYDMGIDDFIIRPFIEQTLKNRSKHLLSSNKLSLLYE